MKLKHNETWNGKPGVYTFWCPGCKSQHLIPTVPGQSIFSSGATWGFNGSVDRPTFTPSVFIRTGHYAEGKPKAECWACNNGHNMCEVCHSFVTDGKIQFLNDCTHHLAGQTVELPEVDEQGLPINKTD
jgi:hypothetical protein